MRMFAGLMSRWTMPRLCAYDRPLRTSMTMSIFSTSESGAIAEQLVEVGAFDELHGDERMSVDFTEVVDRDDVRVLQRPGRLCLAKEPRAQVLVARDGVAHHFDRDRAVEHRVDAAIDDAHRAFADLADDLVFADLGEFALRHFGETWARLGRRNL